MKDSNPPPQSNAIASRLREVAEGLASEAATFERAEITEPLAALEASAEEIAQAWSGSSLGYHSLVYNKGLLPPSPGERFNAEWGFLPAFSNSTRGDWIQHRFDDVIEAIEERAGHPDLTRADEAAKAARDLFDESSAEVISLISTYLRVQEDAVAAETLEKVKGLHPISQDAAIRLFLPQGQLMSRDSEAIHQGVKAAPHQVILAKIIVLRDAARTCSELAKLGRRLAVHIERAASDVPPPHATGNMVFIGHGRSSVWRELKDFIKDRLGLPWDEFNRVPVAGLSNLERLNEMLDAAAIAFLILTAEDEDADGSVHARLNVVHEAGLFQGRLGFSRAIILLEEGCAEFSNIQGLGQIRFPRGNIASKFEDVRLVLEREGLLPTS